MQGASVKQTRSVCSERARAAAADRSRCVFAKQIRGFSAQSPNPKQMRCRSDDSRQCSRANVVSTRGESNSAQGAGVKKMPHQRRVRRAFPMAAQAESTSRNPHSDWDVVSGWRLKRKLRPRISAQNGMHFPDGLSAESSSRNPASNWDTLSASPAASKNLRARYPKTG